MSEAAAGGAPPSRGSPLRGAAIAVSDQAIVSLTRFGVGVVLARLLAPADFGVFVLCLAIYYFIAALHGAVITDPLMILGAPMAEDAFRRHLGSAARVHLLFCLAAAAALALGWGLAVISGIIGADLAPLIALLAAATVLMLTQAFVRAALFSRNQTGQVLLNDVVFCALQLAALPLLIRHGALTNGPIFSTMAGAALVALGFTPRHYLSSAARLGAAEVGATLRRNWAIGKWLAGTALADWLTMQASFFLAAARLGLEAPAVLKACQNLVAPTHILLMGLEGILIPAAAHRFSAQGLRALNGYLLRASMGLTALVALYLAALALDPEYYLSMVYGGSYSGHALVVLLIAGQYILYPIMKPLSIGLKVTGHARTVFHCYLLIACVSSTLIFLLMPAYGIPGVAASMALGTLGGAVLLVIRHAAEQTSSNAVPGVSTPLAEETLD